MTTPQIKRADNFQIEHTPTEPSYQINLSTKYPQKISVRTKFPKKISMKARNNIFQKIKQLGPKLKAPIRKEGKKYSRPSIKIYKFTADEAVETAPAQSNKLGFESQKLETDTKTANSRSHITVTKFTPNDSRNRVNKFLRQTSYQSPLKSGRRSDDDSQPSYKITPNIQKGGYKISPVKRIDGSWLLRSPDGTEFHFKSLQQIYELNQNNFVPGK